MLRAVAVASPRTMNADGTYIRLNHAGIPFSTYNVPASRAFALIELMSSLRRLLLSPTSGRLPRPWRSDALDDQPQGQRHLKQQYWIPHERRDPAAEQSRELQRKAHGGQDRRK